MVNPEHSKTISPGNAMKIPDEVIHFHNSLVDAMRSFGIGKSRLDGKLRSNEAEKSWYGKNLKLLKLN